VKKASLNPALPIMKCAKCKKDITEAKKFKEKRYCLGQVKPGQYRFDIFCIECEPEPKMLDHHH
jgi:hypothetical protein